MSEISTVRGNKKLITETFDVVLEGGPPWGFTLTGGSEFGEDLCVKKTTTDHVRVGSQLQAGDEIVALNGVAIASRELALQVLRATKHNLPLTIKRVIIEENQEEMTMAGLNRSGYHHEPNYKIVSIEKDSVSNKHSIRIGIKQTRLSRNASFDASYSSGYDKNTPDSSPSIGRSFNSYNKITPDSSPSIGRSFNNESVEAESVQKVSDARAMFENMATTKKMKSKQTKSKNKSPTMFEEQRKPAPLLIQTLTSEPKPMHMKSRSLPVEMPLNKTPPPQTLNNKQKDFDRPKSAYSFANDKPEPKPPTRFSSSDLMKPMHPKLAQNIESNRAPCYSVEDVRYSSADERKKIQTKINDSANELRQAANRYHQELLKNYPHFRNSILSNENKSTSSSTSSEDQFARNEPLRATIATTTSNRSIPRSFSANNKEEVEDVINNEQSMMGRLLRGNQESASLVRITEEQRNPRQRTWSNTSSQSMSAINLTTRRASDQLPEKKTFQHNLHLHRKSASDIHNNNSVSQEPVSLTSPQYERSLSSPLNDLLYTHVETDIDSPEAEALITRDEQTESSATPIHLSRESLSTPGNHYRETSLDGVGNETSHERDLSSDSAVYEINHKKGLSMESTDSMRELEEIEQNRLQVEEDFPPPPEDMLHDDREKEKPQRTINRKKKEEKASSRNNSCVSTDSTTSTATADSGIVVSSDLSPRSSPLSSEDYYKHHIEHNVEDSHLNHNNLDNHELSNRVQDDQHNGEDRLESHDHQDTIDQIEPHATSTPERNDYSYQSEYTSFDRRGSQGPRIDKLDGEKTELIASMKEKIEELRLQEQEIGDEIRINEDLGKKVKNMVETKATQSEFSKFELFIGELNKIVALMLSLTQRLHRYELMLQELSIQEEEEKTKRDGLVAKIDKLKSQHEEACYLREVNDKRGDNVALFIQKYCTEDEFADFQYYVDMKSQLALMQSEINEKVKLGEERLKALECTGQESWAFT